MACTEQAPLVGGVGYIGELNGVYAASSVAPLDRHVFYVDAGERFANLGTVINAVANEIARKTRRGAANFIVVNSTVDIVELERRVSRLEQEVTMWETAAKTLKEINDELREAAELDRQERMPEIQINLRPVNIDDVLAQGTFYCPRIPTIGGTGSKNEYLPDSPSDPVAAYNRAMKFVR